MPSRCGGRRARARRSSSLLLLLWFARRFAFDVARELVERAFPERAIAIEELACALERLCFEMDVMEPPITFATQEARALEDDEMLRDGGQRHRQGVGDLR